jgi:uncharacterized membrane protein YccC
MSEAPAQAGGGIRRWAERHRARLGLSARIVTAALATFAAAHLIGFAQSYWAVLTSVIVMQASVGGSIQATLDRLIGSLGGAVWGVAVCLTVPHASVAGLGVALAIALAPLAVLTAFRPAWRIASITAIILLLTPTSQAGGPVAAGVQRLLEVGLGSFVAVVVAMVLAPGRAHGALARAAATALAAMAELTPLIMAGLAHARDPLAVEGVHAQIRAAIAEAETAADDARRERAVSLVAAVDPDPLCRTLRRLHHDLVMVGRATVTPLPEPARTAMAAPAERVGLAVARFLAETGTGLARRAPAPSQAQARASLAAFGAAVADLRASGVTRDLPDDAVARLFGLTFGFEQLGANLDDLTARAAELAGPGRSH